jgi:glycosyltransferase involved in cell wall biosynthesis
MKAAICLVSPSHLANNPRLVKEADALHAAGYRVHVVCGRYFPLNDPFDAQIRAASPWSVTTVDYRATWKTLPDRLRHRLARARIARTASPGLELAGLASHRAYRALAAAASRVDAVLYLGHTLAGLAAAAAASRIRRAAYGFDAEDFHPAETTQSENDPALRASIATLESTLLPHAATFTAASPLIAETYRRAYALSSTPATVLNVFPLADAPPASAIPPSAPSPAAPRRLYWFSQTIGPGRGLETLLPALAHLQTPVSLHLRGLPAATYPETLRRAAHAAGFSGPIEFLPLGPAADMMKLAAPYDLGLSLEQNTPLNRDLCLTNKIFTYLLAGLPVALTPTRAQTALAATLGQAALLLDPTDPAATARRLDALLGSPATLTRARLHALSLGRETYNWEREQHVLLSTIHQALRLLPSS